MTGPEKPVEEILENEHGQVILTTKLHYCIWNLRIKEKTNFWWYVLPS
jgi:hypothetical protein